MKTFVLILLLMVAALIGPPPVFSSFDASVIIKIEGEYIQIYENYTNSLLYEFCPTDGEVFENFYNVFMKSNFIIDCIHEEDSLYEYEH